MGLNAVDGRQRWVERADAELRSAIAMAEKAMSDPLGVVGTGWDHALKEASRCYGRAGLGGARAIVDEVRDIDFALWAEVPGCRSCGELVEAAALQLQSVLAGE